MLEPRPAQVGLVRSGALTFAGVAGAAATVYVLQVAMGRMLPVTDYSLYAALSGIFNMVAVPLSAVLLVVTRAAALAAGRGDSGEVAAVRHQAVRELTIGGAAALVLGIAASGLLAGALGSSSPWPVVVMWIAVAANVALALGLALLQGAHRFMPLTVANFASAIVRLVSSLALVSMGFGVAGTMAGAALACGLGSIAVWVALGPSPASEARRHQQTLSQEVVARA